MEEEKKELEQWRVRLGALSVNRRKQISEEMPLHNATLARWITGERSPQNEHTVRKLAQYAPELAADLKDAYPDAFETDDLQIPLANVLRIISDVALISKNVNLYTVTNGIGEDLVSLLDPAQDGLFILPFFLCTPNERGQMTQLRSGEGYGTGDWGFQQIECPFVIGGNSLCGLSIKQLRPVLHPYHHPIAHNARTLYIENIRSAIALPILRRGECAGTLLIGSVHPDFFTKSRRELCDRYSKLYPLALYDNQFYSPAQIALE